MQVLDLAEIRKFIVQVLLARLFVYIGYDNDPAFDGAYRSCVGVSLHRGGLAFAGGAAGDIDVHLIVSHREWFERDSMVQ